MSVWTHPICDRCWSVLEPNRRPVRVMEEDRDRVKCCWCEEPTKSGIYRRADPWDLPKHSAHADERASSETITVG